MQPGARAPPGRGAPVPSRSPRSPGLPPGLRPSFVATSVHNSAWALAPRARWLSPQQPCYPPVYCLHCCLHPSQLLRVLASRAPQPSRDEQPPPEQEGAWSLRPCPSRCWSPPLLPSGGAALRSSGLLLSLRLPWGPFCGQVRSAGEGEDRLTVTNYPLTSTWAPIHTNKSNETIKKKKGIWSMLGSALTLCSPA